MIDRSLLKVGHTLLYLPGGVECEVTNLDRFCIEVRTNDDDTLVEIPPDEYELYDYGMI